MISRSVATDLARAIDWHVSPLATVYVDPEQAVADAVGATTVVVEIELYGYRVAFAEHDERRLEKPDGCSLILP